MKKVLLDGTPYTGTTSSKSTRLDTLTGDEFKQLIEQLSPDGKINTIPELIEFLNGIPEGMTLEEYVAEHGGGTPSPGSVGMVELNDEVKTKIQKVYDEDDEAMFMDFDEADVNNSQAAYEVGADDGEDDV